MGQQSSNLLIYTFFCFTNAAYTIIPILQDKHYVSNNPKHTFYHPLMQTELMIFGEMVCLAIFYLEGGRKEAKDGRPRAPILVCFVPLLMDLFATTLELIAMNYLSGSVYNITSSIVIVSSAFFTKILLKKQFNKIQILGCVLVVFGVVITGVGEQLGQSSSSQKEQNEFLLGIILTVVAFTIQGLQMVVAQIIFLNYSITPLEYVGICGLLGTVFWTLVLIVLSFLGCPLAQRQCVQDQKGNSHMEHFPTFFRDISESAFQISMVIIFVLVNVRNNYYVNVIIKTKNAMLYQLVSIFSNGLVWALGIIITLLAGANQEYQIESLNSSVLAVKFVGFMVSTFGLLLYQQYFVNRQKQELVEQIQ